MSKSEVKCQNCGKMFLAENREINRGNAKYCSLSCSSKMTRDMKYTFVCKHCGKEFKSASNKALYCSNSCKQKNYRAKQKSTLDNSKCIKYYYSVFEKTPCEICGWKNTVRDLHHIVEVSEGGTNELNNLISVCPNYHREIHRNLISKDDLIKIVENRTISSS